MKKILIYIRLIIQYQIIFGVFFFNVNFSSMFPNVYQYEISKTNLKTRAMNNYSMPLVDAQMAMPLQDKEDRGITCYVLGMFFKSTDSDFGCSFSIDRKSKMKVAGDDSGYLLTRDIRAEFVGGESNTNIDMSLEGNENMEGCKILIQFPLDRIFKSDLFEDWFFSIRTSLVRLEQQLIMKLEGTPESSFSGIRNFFANTTKQAKIDSKPRSKIDFENISLTLDGIYHTKHNSLEIYYYTGVEIPTNLTYRTPYLFDPIVGNNGNIGLLLGADFHGYFYNKFDKRIGIILELENHFLFYKTIDRTFDLYNQKYVHGLSTINRNKPWSRYLPAISLENPTKEVLVGEVSTLPVRIHECNNLDVSVGVILNIINKNDTRCYFVGGYNLWMSQPEYPELQDRVYQKEYHNFNNYDIRGRLPNTTSSQTIIKAQLEDDLTINNFNINDLDCGSVVSDGAYSQSIFMRGSVIGCNGYSLLLGGWYEVGKYKMAPSRIGAWLGCGCEF
jgi:hypothetical protein